MSHYLIAGTERDETVYYSSGERGPWSARIQDADHFATRSEAEERKGAGWHQFPTRIECVEDA